MFRIAHGSRPFSTANMGSHGYTVMPCVHCNVLGQCLTAGHRDAGYVGLWDIDGTGVVCDACVEWDSPNNQHRCAEALALALGRDMDAGIRTLISQFIAPNGP